MTRSKGWVLIGSGALVAFLHLLDIRDQWALFGKSDWFVIAAMMTMPAGILWRYLKIAQGPAEQIGDLGVAIAIGGCLPLWFAFRLVERVTNG